MQTQTMTLMRPLHSDASQMSTNVQKVILPRVYAHLKRNGIPMTKIDQKVYVADDHYSYARTLARQFLDRWE